VISGGQTGVDRAALDAALDAGLACGGWCPAGRWAEDGPIPARYPLTETPEADSGQRTRRNVLGADATLIIVNGMFDQGTRLTRQVARELDRAHLVVDLSKMEDGSKAVEIGCARVLAWMTPEKIRILNIAGPRESTAPGIYNRARSFLTSLFVGLDD
jgi:hypothetical protein